MSAYGRVFARLVLLGVMVSSAALISKPVEAATCQQTCLTNEQICARNCHGFGTCVGICGEAYQQCLKRC